MQVKARYTYGHVGESDWAEGRRLGEARRRRSNGARERLAGRARLRRIGVEGGLS